MMHTLMSHCAASINYATLHMTVLNSQNQNTVG